MPFSKKLARYARRTLLTLVVLATLVAGFVIEENWRGGRAWQEYAARQAALGDPVDVFPAPSSLPPERNFMKTPVLDRVLFAQDGSEELEVFERMGSPKVPGGSFQAWRAGRLSDLAAVAGIKTPEGADAAAARAAYLAGADAILAANAQAEMLAVLEELRQAVPARTESQVVRPVAITRAMPPDVPLPRLLVVRNLSSRLAVDACAALASGRHEQGWLDAMALVRLTRGFTDLPDGCLLESMAGGLFAQYVSQPVYEAWVRRSWTEAQWTRLQEELAKVTPLRSLERSLRVERAFVVNSFENVPVRKILLQNTASGETYPWWARSLEFIPGWVYRNKIAAAEDLNQRTALLGQSSTPGFLARLREDDARRERLRGPTTPANVLMQAATPDYRKVTDSALRAESTVALTRAVCALERHRLARGQYPETLAELVPAFLAAVPIDVIDGQPLRYRRLADGTFKLYSIGLNGTDDDGAPSDWKTGEGPRHGDWCWPQPAQ